MTKIDRSRSIYNPIKSMLGFKMGHISFGVSVSINSFMFNAMRYDKFKKENKNLLNSEPQTHTASIREK
jgi:hypothetical protein